VQVVASGEIDLERIAQFMAAGKSWTLPVLCTPNRCSYRVTRPGGQAS